MDIPGEEPTIDHVLQALSSMRVLRNELWVKVVREAVGRAQQDRDLAENIVIAAFTELGILLRTCKEKLPEGMSVASLQDAAGFIQANSQIERSIVSACQEKSCNCETAFRAPEDEDIVTWYQGVNTRDVMARFLRRFARNRWRRFARRPVEPPRENQQDISEPAHVELQLSTFEAEVLTFLVEYYITFLHKRICVLAKQEGMKHMQELRVATRLLVRGRGADQVENERVRTYVQALETAFGKGGTTRPSYREKHKAVLELFRELKDFPVLAKIEIASILWLATALALHAGEMGVGNYVKDYIPPVPPKTTVRTWAPNLLAHATEFARSIVGTWMINCARAERYQGAAKELFDHSPLSLNGHMLVDEWNSFRFFLRETERGL